MARSVEYSIIERVAEISIGRGCGFAGLGIVTFVVGLVDQPHVALTAAGLLTLVMSFVLWLRAERAQVTPYKRTEAWVMLEADQRPGPDIAQRVIGTILRDTYTRFALHAGLVSVGLLATSAILLAVR